MKPRFFSGIIIFQGIPQFPPFSFRIRLPEGAENEAALGFYGKWIFPRLCDFLLNNKEVNQHRKTLLSTAGGKVLEIGFGTGLNLPYYPKEVTHISTVDPNPGMHSLALKRLKKTGVKVDKHLGKCDSLPFEDNAFDCVISTFTLCSIAEINPAMREIWRVIKPGGNFLFFEHGLNPEPRVQWWQQRLNWLQMKIGLGCRLDRNIKELVANQPFASVAVKEFYLKMQPKTHGYTYHGLATK